MQSEAHKAITIIRSTLLLLLPPRYYSYSFRCADATTTALSLFLFLFLHLNEYNLLIQSFIQLLRLGRRHLKLSFWSFHSMRSLTHSHSHLSSVACCWCFMQIQSIKWSKKKVKEEKKKKKVTSCASPQSKSSSPLPLQSLGSTAIGAIAAVVVACAKKKKKKNSHRHRLSPITISMRQCVNCFCSSCLLYSAYPLGSGRWCASRHQNKSERRSNDFFYFSFNVKSFISTLLFFILSMKSSSPSTDY